MQGHHLTTKPLPQLVAANKTITTSSNKLKNQKTANKRKTHILQQKKD